MSVPNRGDDRPRDKRSYLPASARRAQILEVARKAFAARGFHVVSIADICEAAGIGRGTLYQYFGNKRDVFHAVVEDLYERVRTAVEARERVADVDPAVLRQLPPKAIIAFSSKSLRATLDAIFADEASLRLVVREARGLDGGVDEIIRSIDAIVLDRTAADLRVGHELGVLKCPKPELTAQFILGGIEKMLLTALGSGGDVDLDTIVQAAVHIQFHGLLSDRTRSQST